MVDKRNVLQKKKKKKKKERKKRKNNKKSKNQIPDKSKIEYQLYNKVTIRLCKKKLHLKVIWS